MIEFLYKTTPYVAYVALVLALFAIIKNWHCVKSTTLVNPKQNYVTAKRFGDAKIGKVGTILRSQIPIEDRKHFDSKVLQATAPRVQIKLPEEYDFAQAFPNMSCSVLDQKDCGSCWAFSVTGSASDRIRRISPIFLDVNVEVDGDVVKNQLSPYLLAACDNCSLLDQQPDFVRNAKLVIDANKCSVGCDGGVIEYALIYLDHNGLISIDCNQGSIGQYRCHKLESLKQIDNLIKADLMKFHKQCKFWQFKTPIKVALYENSQLTTATKLKANEEAIKTEIFLHGPVSSGYMVYQSFYDFFEKNPKGIYAPEARPKDADEEKGGHAVVFTGWGTENGVPYWIARNSWGKKWGDNWYFRIIRGQNFCECESDVFAARMFIKSGCVG
jgi:hypothetical protein